MIWMWHACMLIHACVLAHMLTRPCPYTSIMHVCNLDVYGAYVGCVVIPVNFMVATSLVCMNVVKHHQQW